jgi:predicted TIM-barrel fold metal-dependent hydrolase
MAREADGRIFPGSSDLRPATSRCWQLRITCGSDRIMFASDYPYDDMATDAARWIESAPVSENDRGKICYGNAAALFGLPR